VARGQRIDAGKLIELSQIGGAELTPEGGAIDQRPAP
jgi:hypothetical protein